MLGLPGCQAARLLHLAGLTSPTQDSSCASAFAICMFDTHCVPVSVTAVSLVPDAVQRGSLGVSHPT